MKEQRSPLAATLLVVLGTGALVAACGNELTADEEIASTLLASTIDTFDDGDVSDWHDFAGPASTISHRLSTSRANTGTTSLKMTYNISAGGYGGLERLFTSPQNWSTATNLSLWVYGLGTGHRFGVQIYDAGAERWETSFAVNFSGWRQVTLPLSSFSAVAWQPSGARVDGVRDLQGIGGMVLLPSIGGQLATGSVYIDSMVTAQTIPAPSPAPAPAPIAAPASTVVPLYTYPTDPSWAAVAAAKVAHPTVPVFAVVNPSNGPGASVDAAYAKGIGQLQAAGVKVFGYVHTSWGVRATADVVADMDRWRANYPGVSGIFFDEQANSPGHESYYRNLTAYAKAHSLTFTIGNPGADTTPGYVGTVDLILIYENAGLPPLDALAGWHLGYDKSNFGIIPYNCPTIDAAFVQTARQRVGSIYLQNDNLPNPWDSVPGTFGALLDRLL